MHCKGLIFFDRREEVHLYTCHDSLGLRIKHVLKEEVRLYTLHDFLYFRINPMLQSLSEEITVHVSNLGTPALHATHRSLHE